MPTFLVTFWSVLTTRKRQFCPVCGEFRAASRGRLWPWTRLHCARDRVSWWHLSLSRGLFGEWWYERLADRIEVWWRGGCRECRGVNVHKMDCSTGRAEGR